MAIASSRVVRVADRGHRLRVFEEHTDHLGVLHYRSYSTTDKRLNTGTALTRHATLMEGVLKEREVEAFIEKIRAGVDPNTIVLNHATLSDCRTRLQAVYDDIEMEAIRAEQAKQQADEVLR